MSPKKVIPQPFQRTDRPEELHRLARRVRRHILRMIVGAESGHPGGCLSQTDLLTALYGSAMSHQPDDPLWPMRDRFILSKGHGAAGLYALLAECGYLPIEELAEYRHLGSRLQGHPALDRALPGVEASTGSLGMGLSIANGLALAAKLELQTHHIWVLLGDGELQSGNIWEAAMTSAHHRLDNLTAIVDNNGLQIDGTLGEVKNLSPLAEKFRAFNWNVMEISGHDMEQILGAYLAAKAVRGSPTCIIAHTVKGRGVDYMEGRPEWHAQAPHVTKLAPTLAAIDRYYKPIYERYGLPWPPEADEWPR